MSSTIKSGLCSRASSTATSPKLVVSTVYPWCSSKSVKNRRFRSLSSTIKTVLGSDEVDRLSDGIGSLLQTNRGWAASDVSHRSRVFDMKLMFNKVLSLEG